MGSAPLGSTQVLLVIGLVVVVQGDGPVNSVCTITAFEDRKNSTLAMCSLLNQEPLHDINFSWYYCNSTSVVTNVSEMASVDCTQTTSASFINISATSNRTGQFVCIVSGPGIATTNCTLQVKTKCAQVPPTVCCDTQVVGPRYGMKEITRGFSGNKSISSIPTSGYSMSFIPVGEDVKRVNMCECPVLPVDPHHSTLNIVPPPVAHSQSVPLVISNLTTITTPTTPSPRLPSVTKTTAVTPTTTQHPPCIGQDKWKSQNGVTQFQVSNFQVDCQGVYMFTKGSNIITAVLIRMREDDNEDDGDDDNVGHDQDDPHKYTAVIVGVVLAAVAAVVVAVFYFVRRRRLLHNSRQPMRNKMVSTISGSKVHMFNNMAYSKEEKSDLEEFPRKHIRFLDTIGKGTFGTVVMAEALNLLQKKKGPMSRNWARVAVKMTLISDKSNEELKSDFLCELALMKTIPPHVNIITLYASCTAHDPYLMILEYARHGDLRKHLLEHRMERNYANAAFSAYGVSHKKEGHYASAAVVMYGNKKDKFEGNIYAVPGETRYTDSPSGDNDLITSRDLLSYALQICRGLEHLIRNKIVHRDVAARNILLFDHNIVKISDFGLARKIGQGDVYERTRKGLLPIRWMSTEALFYNQFTEKSDVWSYGVLLWELITLGSTPYPGLDANTVLEKIRAKELLVCPPHSSAIVNNIVNSCWKDDPNSRPTFVQLCQELEQLLEAEVEYVDLDQMNDHEYSTLDGLED